MNKKMFFLFIIIVSFTFQQCKIKNVIYIDENNICMIQKEDGIYFSTITDNWIYKDSLIVSLMSGEKKKLIFNCLMQTIIKYFKEI